VRQTKRRTNIEFDNRIFDNRLTSLFYSLQTLAVGGCVIQSQNTQKKTNQIQIRRMELVYCVPLLFSQL